MADYMSKKGRFCSRDGQPGVAAAEKKCKYPGGGALFSVQMGEISVNQPDSHLFWPKTGKYVRNGAFYTFTGEIPGQARNEAVACPE